jgi:hypothetical protein
MTRCSAVITQRCNRQRGESSFAVVFVDACVLFTALIIIIIIFSPQIANPQILRLNPQSQISRFQISKFSTDRKTERMKHLFKKFPPFIAKRKVGRRFVWANFLFIKIRIRTFYKHKRKKIRICGFSEVLSPPK